MRTLFTEIMISAPAELVWRILIDFSKYPEWNPFIVEAEGEAGKGSQLKIRIDPPGGRSMTFKPVVKQVVENRNFCWLGRLVMPGLFDGEHCFEIIPDNKGNVRFIQRETFRGILVPFFWKSLEGPTKQGFKDMNESLKKTAEAMVV